MSSGEIKYSTEIEHCVENKKNKNENKDLHILGRVKLKHRGIC